jgi:hypothetical protein
MCPGTDDSSEAQADVEGGSGQQLLNGWRVVGCQLPGAVGGPPALLLIDGQYR